MTAHRNCASLLKANPFFARLEPEALEAVAALCVPRTLNTEETLFVKGDEGDALYAVRRGRIRIATGTQTGRRLTRSKSVAVPARRIARWLRGGFGDQRTTIG